MASLVGHIPICCVHSASSVKQRSAWCCGSLQQSRVRIARQTLSVRAQTVEAPSRTKEPSAPGTSGTSPSYVSLSDKYAIVDAAGTQLLLEEGRWYTCNRLQAEPGSTIRFGRVLGSKDNGKFTAGRPYLDNVVVEAEILEELKGEKVIVYKMKPKKHYQRKNGHRQPLTKFLVTKIAIS